MSRSRRFVQVLISVIAILMMAFSGFRPAAVQAQAGDGLKRQWNAQSGRISFIGPETGRAVSASKALGTFLRPQDPGLALAKRFAPEFGIKNPERDLTEMKAHKSIDGRMTVRYQQRYQGIPVIGGELVVNTNEGGDLYSMNGEVSPALSLPTQPKVDSALAAETALQAVAMLYQKTPADFIVSAPELWIYDESLLRPSTAPAELVWRMEVTAKDKDLPVRELVLVDAQRGNISLHFNQIDTEWQPQGSRVPALASIPQKTESSLTGTRGAGQELTGSPGMALLPTLLVSTYTAGNTSSLPGSFLCNQTDPNCSSGDSDARAAHKYAIGTSNFYATQFNRNSIDNNGMNIVSTVHYCDLEDPFLGCPYANAFWSGTQMVYGDAYGFALADDVVAHELSHGVTQYESNLFYYYQAGAINESFSDVFGEYYDQINGQGSDGPGDLWLIGEDISGLGTIRSMSDPPAFDNPDKMSSPLYYKEEGDNGGVHYNSGINNKAAFLMVGGGTFNGKTVTALGWEKVGAIYYEVNSNLLTSGADYSDLYFALQQACTNLLGQHGITSGDCTQIKNAADAVEMNGQPEPNFNTDAPLCGGGDRVNTSFYEGLENGLSNWTLNNGDYTRWQIDSPDGAYARSGLHSLFANGVPAGVTDATARLAPIVIPTDGYLHFAQAYGFASLGPGYYFDGGVLEYSTNGGDTWVDAGSLVDYNGYNDTIFTDFGNPLAGRSGFVGASHGYISTRLNLSSLAGQSVTFRWRMGLGDFSFFGDSFGWWLDDIRVYNCVASTVSVSGNAGAAGAKLNYMDGTSRTVTADGSGNYSITVPLGWSGTITPSLNADAFCPASQTYNNLQSGQTAQNYAHTACPNFGAIGKWTSSFDLSHGWTVADYVRTVGDVSGDGRADLVGFGLDGVYVALSNGNSFNAVSKWTSSFDLSHGWTVSQYVRSVGDVNGDGKADLVGFGLDGVYVGLSTGSGFSGASKWTSAFDLSHGWTVSDFVRTVGDINGDGKADLVGFGSDGVYVALSTGNGFSAGSKWTSAFDLSHGWTMSQSVRTVGDVNGDGKADLVGFGLGGVYVALSTGSGFSAASKWTGAFDVSNGWTVSDHVRTVGDVNGDGRADVVGFGLDGVYISLSTGTTFSLPGRRTTSFDLSHGWTVAQYVRTVGDVNGGGKADLVGFGLDGVYIATSK